MADEKRFSHITVNASEDNDVVIQAGAYAPAAQAEPQAWEQPQADQAYYDGLEPAAPVPAPQPQEEERYDYQPEPAHVPAHAKAPEAQRRAKREEYHEQTLEDLDVGPMSKMQKIVLGVVAVFIIGFAVYYFAFMH